MKCRQNFLKKTSEKLHVTAKVGLSENHPNIHKEHKIVAKLNNKWQ